MIDTIPPHSTVQAAHQAQGCGSLASETVILQLKKGVYYSLDRVGSRIWELLQRPWGFGELREMLLAEYEVEPEQCERDLLALLQQLEGAGLIEIGP